MPWAEDFTLAERKAFREGREDWRETLHGHAKFFLILTGAFGAVSGAGIWFSIGLTNPEATSALIHNFVFGWAIEWVFFMVELTTAAVYYYTWDRIDPSLHMKVGWLYAAASLFTLVIINGILTFMLTPGESWLSVAGTGNEASRFWQAFFNPTYFPSLLLRICVYTSLAGIWALITTSRIDGDERPALKTQLVRWSAKWLLPSFVLMPFLLGWYLWSVPESQRALLNLGVSTIGSGMFTQVTRSALVIVMTSATIIGVVYFFAYRNPREFTPAHAFAVLFLALLATGAGEYSRELIRKPYVVGCYMYANGTRVRSVNELNQSGYLKNTLWTRTDLSPHMARGEAMFRGQCMSCHTAEGYRSMRQLLNGRNRDAISNFLKTLHEHKSDTPYWRFMPPLVGTADEIVSLGDYLSASFAPQRDLGIDCNAQRR